MYQNCLNLVFCVVIMKKYCHIWNQQPRIFLIPKFVPKQKSLNLESKMSDFGYSNNYCHIWNRRPWICLTKNFCVRMKVSNFGAKNALFGYFRVWILKNYSHIWNQRPKFFLITKRNLRVKKSYIWNQNLEKLLSYLKLAPSNLSYCKVWCKNKSLEIWNQKCLIWVFLSWNYKITLLYLKSATLNLPNWNILWKNKYA